MLGREKRRREAVGERAREGEQEAGRHVLPPFDGTRAALPLIPIDS